MLGEEEGIRRWRTGCAGNSKSERIPQSGEEGEKSGERMRGGEIANARR